MGRDSKSTHETPCAGLILGLLLVGCGTAQPLTRGEPTPTATPVVVTPVPTPDPNAPTPDPDDPTPGPEPTPVPTPVPPSFSTEVKPLLESCKSCHADGAGGWTYDGGSGAYEAVLLEINLADPAASPLLIKSSGGDNHNGGTFYTPSSTEYQLILGWITAGAPNN